MNLPRIFSAFFLSCCALVALAPAAGDSGKVYELRTYTAAPGKMDGLMARFRDHTTKLFEKHGMVNVGYWVLADVKEGEPQKLVYLLEYPSREAAAASWKNFSADPQWKEVARKSEEGGKLVAKVDSVYLTPTDFAKSMNVGAKAGGPARVFELRTYTAAEGKLPHLDTRFRDHTVALFAKHGMANLGYFHPLDANKGAGNTLIYFLAYPSREAATAAWQKFRVDPDWVKAKADSEKDGALTTKVEGVFLLPADFSAVR
ncbi:MAG: NIPSNAP family protein [Opitutaceae bacterium]